MERFHNKAADLFRWLIIQAQHRKLVTFSDAGREIGVIPYGIAPYLGCISQGLQTMPHADTDRIPMIQLIVVNRDGLPGWRAAPYIGLTRKQFEGHSCEELQELFQSAQEEVFDYPNWDRVFVDFECYLATQDKRNERGKPCQ